MNFWKREQVVVTGGHGFLGSYVVEKIKEKGCEDILYPNHERCDLLREDRIHSLFINARPSTVIHLAARVGGIGANQKHPGLFFYENMKMGMNVLECSRIYKTRKVVMIGTVCSYPNRPKRIPFEEIDIWDGYPELTNAPYGIAKRALLTMSWAYREEYGMNIIYLIPTNLFGPRDSFDPEKSHVIPALIKKFVDARNDGTPSVEIWGNGEATREFLYVKDAAEGIVLATEHYNEHSAVNLGSDYEIRIDSLAHMIAKMTGYRGCLIFNGARPEGQPRRLLDTYAAWEKFGFITETKFEDGLKETINYYEENHANKETV